MSAYIRRRLSRFAVDTSTAPSRPSKHPERYRKTSLTRSGSPLPSPTNMIASVQASSSLAVPQQSMLLAQRKPSSVPNGKLQPIAAPLGHIRETLPMPFILQPPEEQTDNWDDDFEEGISLSKLHGTFILHV